MLLIYLKIPTSLLEDYSLDISTLHVDYSECRTCQKRNNNTNKHYYQSWKFQVIQYEFDLTIIHFDLTILCYRIIIIDEAYVLFDSRP